MSKPFIMKPKKKLTNLYHCISPKNIHYFESLLIVPFFMKCREGLIRVHKTGQKEGYASGKPNNPSASAAVKLCCLDGPRLAFCFTRVPCY